MCDTVDPNFRRIYRGFFLFDTSSLGAGATISATVMSLYGTGMTNDLGGTPSIDVYTTTPASNTVLVAEDYDQIGTTSQTGTPILYSSWSIAGYNDFTLNATGRGNVSKTSISKFGTREVTYDVANTAPAWGSGLSVFTTCYFAEQAGTANDPKLVVTYTKSESYITITKNWALE
jgi:hypothetical protein